MKKFRTLLITLCAMATTLTSCDEDLTRAITLSGEWEGDFGMYYEYEYYGRVYRFDSYDTRIVFYPDHDYATYGYGKQVDYYEYGPYAYQHYRFRWYINISRGDLILEYPYDPSLNTVIHDYHMYSDRFYGYFGTSNTKFYLYKLTDYYDWGNYNGDYYYDPRGNWYDYYPYYAKREVTDDTTLTRAEPMGNDATTVTEGIIRRDNRFNETN